MEGGRKLAESLTRLPRFVLFCALVFVFVFSKLSKRCSILGFSHWPYFPFSHSLYLSLAISLVVLRILQL